jgi:UDP-N-acetylglucosamine 2-epimerase
VGLNDERVMQAVALLQTQGRGNERSLRLVQDYSPQEVSAKVLRILVSYVDYVNRRVWRVQG